MTIYQLAFFSLALAVAQSSVAALPPDYDPLEPRGPSNCSTYDQNAQDRDGYFFDAAGYPISVMSWDVLAKQTPLSALYEVYHTRGTGDDDYYASISTSEPGQSGTGWREQALAAGFNDSGLWKQYNGKSIIGWVEGKCQPGTARLSRFYSRRYTTHYYSLNGVPPSTTQAPIDADWTPEEAYEGFVWTSQVPDSEPLKRCHYKANGRYSSRILSQSALASGALKPGYTCESTPLGYVLPHSNYYFKNEAKTQALFTQRCNTSAYPGLSAGCYPLPANTRDRANLGGGFYQTSTNNPLAKPVQRMSFTVKTSDFYTANNNSHLAFGLLSSLSVTGTYVSPVVSDARAVVLGIGAHNGCPAANGQPTVWLEPMGVGSIIADTCGQLVSSKGTSAYTFRNGRTYNIVFEVDRDLARARYTVTNTASPSDSTSFGWFGIGDKFGAQGFPANNTGYYGTATENLNKDFTVQLSNFQVSWVDRS